ncbi:MAG TPA: transcription elongation factor GreA [Bacilli bacterium]|nr:transcription elongation factor GreA [Bacilli bacterium]
MKNACKVVYLTSEGFLKLEEELNYLKKDKRPEVVKAIKEARALGDLSENADYHAALEEQSKLEARIKELEVSLDNAVIIDEVNDDIVSIGSTIKIKYVDSKEEEIYMIVGSQEADPFNNKISNESPIASAIIGKKSGDIVMVESPNGNYEVKIVEIKRTK